MNERIKELRKQAINFCLDKGSLGNLSEEVSEKFAELIILECANITLDYKTHEHYMGWLDHGDAIVKHFGVKR